MTHHHQRATRRYNITASLRSILHPAFALAVALIAQTAAAGETYTIQIGAFKTVSAEYAAPAREVGDVFGTERANGVVALSVGRFNSTAEANAALNRINMHYPEAFVRRANADARRQFASTPSGLRKNADQTSPLAAESATAKTTDAAGDNSKPSRSTFSDSDTELLRTMTDKERQHVVYLDGQLHYKEGNRFIPLAEYRARSQ